LEHAKENLQYFLVILQSDTHDDTELFCRQTLTADSFLQYLSDKNILVWGGNVKESEAYKGMHIIQFLIVLVASTLGASRYPFMALIAYHDSLMKVVHRFEGICPPEECIDVFNRVSNQLDPTYVAIKAERYCTTLCFS
jgi:FAS-associated factor 2